VAARTPSPRPARRRNPLCARPQQAQCSSPLSGSARFQGLFLRPWTRTPQPRHGSPPGRRDKSQLWIRMTGILRLRSYPSTGHKYAKHGEQPQPVLFRSWVQYVEADACSCCNLSTSIHAPPGAGVSQSGSTGDERFCLRHQGVELRILLDQPTNDGTALLTSEGALFPLAAAAGNVIEHRMPAWPGASPPFGRRWSHTLRVFARGFACPAPRSGELVCESHTGPTTDLLPCANALFSFSSPFDGGMALARRTGGCPNRVRTHRHS